MIFPTLGSHPGAVFSLVKVGNIHRLSVHGELVFQLGNLIADSLAIRIRCNHALHIRSGWDRGFLCLYLGLQARDPCISFRDRGVHFIQLFLDLCLILNPFLSFGYIIFEAFGFISVKVGFQLRLFSLNIGCLQRSVTSRANKGTLWDRGITSALILL